MLDRLGILTDEVSPMLDEALPWISRRGFSHVEIRMVDGANIVNLSERRASEVRKLVEAYGLYVSAIASPVFKCPLDANRRVASGDTFGQPHDGDVESHFQLLEHAFHISDILNTSRIRVFSFWREEEPSQFEKRIVEHLRRAAEAAERRGKLLLLENEPACNGGNAEEVHRLAAQVGSGSLRILWDPGNEAYAGYQAFPDGYEKVKDLVAHVHLKDAVCPDGQGNCVPIGRGSVDFAGQLTALEQDGYTGLFTIETHFIPEGGTPADGSELSWEGLNKIVSRLDG